MNSQSATPGSGIAFGKASQDLFTGQYRGPRRLAKKKGIPVLALVLASRVNLQKVLSPLSRLLHKRDNNTAQAGGREGRTEDTAGETPPSTCDTGWAHNEGCDGKGVCGGEGVLQISPRGATAQKALPPLQDR